MTRKPKKNASITVHLPVMDKEQLAGLAEIDRAGQGASEYVYEKLIMPHLLKLKAETKIKQKIFGLTGSDKNHELHTDLSDRNESTGK